MLVHICCAVDSHYFLERLKEDFPGEKLVGYFYDPNIHPYSEYYLRLLEVKRSCKALGVELIEGEYNFRAWLNAVKGLESEPEKGKRCSVCFDHRFKESAKLASKIGEKRFTSTLLTSPKKSITQLNTQGQKAGEEFGVEFVCIDYRSNSGTQTQNRLAKESKIYRQDYCGCIYALKMQRDEQNRLVDELFSPISGRIEPESIDYRVKLYEERIRLEEQGVAYEIVKERFLNYRLKFALLKVRKKPIPSHILPYSKLKRDFTRGNIEKEIDEVGIFNRDEVKFITLQKYNSILEDLGIDRNYKTVQELIFSPPSFDEELKVRSQISPNSYSLSAILVVKEIPAKKIEIFIDAKIYEDTIERLITFSPKRS
jgi:predicted adenine nucleotide alpha hydrolase (AANH) superfamily ATPase